MARRSRLFLVAGTVLMPRDATLRREAKSDMRSVAESCKRVFASTYFDEPDDASVAPAAASVAPLPALPPAAPLSTAAEQSPDAATPRPHACAGGCAHFDSGGRAKRKAVLIAQDARVARALQESMIQIQRRRPCKLTRRESSGRR